MEVETQTLLAFGLGYLESAEARLLGKALRKSVYSLLQLKLERF